MDTLPQGDFNDAALNVPGWKKVLAGVMAGTTLLAGGCRAGRSHEGNEPPRIIPASVSQIASNIIVVNVNGAPTAGFTEGNTTSIVSTAENKIKTATGSKINFAKPHFLGIVSVTLDDIADRCKTNEDKNSPSYQTPDPVFTGKFLAAALAAAKEKGYSSKEAGSLGLIVFANDSCPNFIRSHTQTADFTPSNIIEMTASLKRLADTDNHEDMAHELGHALGNQHADRVDCPQLRVAPTPDCIKREYGDSRSLMGSFLPGNNALRVPDERIFLNGYNLYRMGVLPNGEVQTITGHGTYDLTLQSLEDLTTKGIRLIRVPRDTKDPQNDYYYVELSFGGRDTSSDEGCVSYVDKHNVYTLKNCLTPYVLSVTVYTADSGDTRYGSHTTQIPLTALPDFGGEFKDFIPNGGLMQAPGGNDVMFTDPSSTTMRLLNVVDRRNGKGSAELQITRR